MAKAPPPHECVGQKIIVFLWIFFSKRGENAKHEVSFFVAHLGIFHAISRT